MYSCHTFIDPVVKCPYYDNHLIAKSRLQRHIVKCEKVSKLLSMYFIACKHDHSRDCSYHPLNDISFLQQQYKGNFKVMCPFNATHRLVKEDLEEHITTCPSRNVFNPEMYPEPTKHGATNFNLHSELSSTVDSTENWDIEVSDSSNVSANDVHCALNNTGTCSKKFDLMMPHCTSEIVSQEADEDHETLRAPRGFSEAMMIEASEDSCIEDLESISSSMGIGRGKVTWKSKLKLIGFGRGKLPDKDL